MNIRSLFRVLDSTAPRKIRKTQLLVNEKRSLRACLDWKLLYITNYSSSCLQVDLRSMNSNDFGIPFRDSLVASAHGLETHANMCHN